MRGMRGCQLMTAGVLCMCMAVGTMCTARAASRAMSGHTLYSISVCVSAVILGETSRKSCCHVPATCKHHSTMEAMLQRCLKLTLCNCPQRS